MNETLVNVAPPPGVYRNGTKYQASGRWYHSNLVRWVEKILRPIGGWLGLRWSQSSISLDDTVGLAVAPYWLYDSFTGAASTDIAVHAADTVDPATGTEYWQTSTEWTGGLSNMTTGMLMLDGAGALTEFPGSLGGGTVIHFPYEQNHNTQVGTEIWWEFTFATAGGGDSLFYGCMFAGSNLGGTDQSHLYAAVRPNGTALDVQCYGRDAGGSLIDSTFSSALGGPFTVGVVYRVGVECTGTSEAKVFWEPTGGGTRTYLKTWTLSTAAGWIGDATRTKVGIAYAGRQSAPATAYYTIYDFAVNNLDAAGNVSVKGAEMTFAGYPRGSVAFRDDSNVSWFAVGTTSDAYKYRDGLAYSLLPWRSGGVTTAGSWDDVTVTVTVDGTFSTGNYGRGLYGRGPYGRGGDAQTLTPADTWTLDNFGPTLVGCFTAHGKIYEDVASAFIIISGAPTAEAIVVTPERFLFALGAGGDRRKVQWCDQGDYTTWTASPSNQAGSYILTTRGSLLSGVRTRRQTMLFTDVDVHAATYVGGDFIYGFEQLGDNCGLIGPHAAVAIGDVTYWMSYNRFFKYDGGLVPLRCDVLEYVFGDFNKKQKEKVWAMTLTQFNEVWWFYPSEFSQAGNECDRYVVYNYADDIWYYGNLARGTGCDRGIFEYPLMMGNTATPSIYQHEQDENRTGETAFVESGPMEIGGEIDKGGQLMRIQHIIPDELNQGEVQALLYTAQYPNATEVEKGPFSLTNPTSVRMTARQVRVRFEEVAQTSWRIGNMRLGVLPAGRR